MKKNIGILLIVIGAVIHLFGWYAGWQFWLENYSMSLYPGPYFVLCLEIPTVFGLTLIIIGIVILLKNRHKS